MNKTLFFFALLISAITYSQVQKVFYVEDVKLIDYVTVNFCVNDEAWISEVTVLPEKTTYQNKEVIEKLIQYLKGIQYYSDSTLRNNCYDSTFEFVNKKYEEGKLDEWEYSKCQEFRKGEFRYTDVRYLETRIKRGKKKQRERGKDFKEKYRITWTSDYQYELKYITVNDKKNKHLIGELIKTEIIGITENGYVYRSKLLNQKEVIGVIEKMK
ncbi:hypothetical protein [uncultured Aquimarina sp.]|uniref:hypothetical protein n=1 Tax=uncultured Aquimarina sp. TaxID=575652 RepID=UPI0026324AC0|nr:hypothetical protein [uncultured Aquimarina sp.]